ncbi:SusC/RagA family TonB-linked outer membrane protein [Hymenobacter sp. AT01-02]|uniref:SusC/RagA family TonB-linked outer membrane protein n=1 Tax=Hymenobacter sp. AT01-02 TaxID=1571877 RepID=UPI00069743C7|nr:TonB-dependent receptor [Hymenobacter sp. AT01-02]
MDNTPTRLGGGLACTTALSAAVLLLPAPAASAQLLAVNAVAHQSTTTSPVESVLLKDLLGRWEAEYGVTIFYESDLVGSKRVLPQTGAALLDQKLTQVLPQAELTFKKLRPNYYVLMGQATASPRAAAGTQALADVTVSGRVTSGGEGLPGVTVVVKGTTIGTSTAGDGTFSLNVPEGSTLVFSSIGFQSREVPVTGATSGLTVNLETDAKALSEVVVVGYGTLSRQEVTTSVASVKSEQIERQRVAGFDQALQGQATGVQVVAPSGAPGAGINIQIRGNSSITGGNSPLYVIDGVPVLPTYDRELSVGNQKPNPLNALNPADIESIDILKDGAAAAIYGVRAANGVVVITTKRGRTGKPQVGFNAYYGVQQIRKKLDVLNARQFAEYYNESQINGGAAPGYPDLNDLPPYDTNWQDEVYRSAAIQNYQLNISGGTDKTHYYVGGGYFKQDGIIQNSGFDRFNFKLNFDQQAGTKLRVGTNVNMSRTNTNGSVRSELGLGNSGTVLGTLAQIPTIPVRDANGAYGLNPFSLSDNPVGNLLETSNKALIYQVIGNLYGEYDILKNLKFRSSLGLDFRTQLENEFITRDYPGTSRADASTRGSGRTGTTQQAIWLWENTVTYNPSLGDRHNLQLLAGQSVQESNRFASNASVRGYASNAVPYLSGGTERLGTSSYEEEWGLTSLFARAIYNFDERYLATLSVRRDGTSRFADHFGYFPAVALGWRISKESFFPQSGPVSDLKLRGSFGINGNQELGYTYQTFSSYSVGSNYTGSAGTIQGGIRPDRIGNRDLKWETSNQYNVGVDFGLFNDRLTLNVDAYRKRSNDLLLSVPLPQSTGAQVLDIIQNVGSVENKGLEFALNTVNVEGQNGGFSWNTNLNLSMNRNKVLDLGTLANDQNQQVSRTIINGSSITQVGQPLGVFYGHKVQGIFQSADEIAAAPAQPGNPQPGDIRFVDVNGDNKINNDDRTIIGNPNPKAQGGVTNTFAFKGIDLSVFFQGSFGNDIYNANRQALESLTGPVNQLTTVLDRWTPTNTNTDIPRAVFNDPNGNGRLSSRWIEDGSYVRLKNVTLGYTLPTSLINKVRVSSLRIYVSGQNLITWTDYTGYDPEVSADPFSSTGFGRDFGVYPQSRTYTIGLNASF